MTRTTERHDVESLRQSVEGRHWTEAEYVSFIGDRNAFIELVGRKLVIHNMPTPAHQLIVARILRRLLGSTAGQAVPAPMPVHLRAGTIREPDIGFYTAAHLDRLAGEIAEPPDLAVEVVSPDSRSIKRDRVEKRAEYARAGIPEYWIVDLKARDVLVLRLDAGAGAGAYAEFGRFAGDDFVTALAAPDVAIRVADMFA
ncbi:MAG: Uma2 family endonuclease [Ardenticatenales bacterium]|nr:Uma2 family endonuclease [Ardenticatenales bacterium]